MRNIITLLLLLLFWSPRINAQHFVMKMISPHEQSGFRALSVVDDSIAWVAGTNGWVGKSTDGGESWNFKQVKGFEKNDFRTLYAFDSKKAIIANVAAPANILLTENGGEDWKIVYTNNDTSAFFDGVDFWNSKEGIIYGDPLSGKMLMLKTTDGGLQWDEVAKAPVLHAGEASFAASGTNIRCYKKNKVIIATGGITSRLWVSTNKGSTWESLDTPIIQDKPSRGIFSLAFSDDHNGVVVGGDYSQDTLKLNHVFYTIDGGRNWIAPTKPTRGYRECVEYLDPDTLVSVGPRGIDISVDGGRNWLPESDENLFHVVRKARKGKLILLAGGKGKIAILKQRER